MERLQEAMQKARNQRQQRAEPGRRPEFGAQTLWDALEPFEPNQDRLEHNRIVTSRINQLGAPFDILRTKVLLTMRKNNWSRLAVTSPTPSCGKTTVCCNLALGFARQADVKACLFEFDLRKPSIARTLDLPDGHDITEMLSGAVPFSEQGQRYRDNVAISAARRAASDPTAIMLNRQTHQTLRDIEAAYQPDITIFDLPPLLVSDDARAFLKEVDCVLIVVRAEKTTIPLIDECEREIAEQCNVMGVVLNTCRQIDGLQSYGYTARPDA